MIELSIIMPVYNTEPFLDRGIRSVCNQTFKNWELILVNDGSTDNSLAICQKYAALDSRIRVIDKPNGGAGSARNAGIEVAIGKYIAFPDSDDWMEGTTYEICMKTLRDQPVDLLLFGEITTVFNDQKSIIEKEIKDRIVACYLPTKEECRKKWPEMILDFHMNAPWNKIYSAAVIKDNNLRFPDLRRMQDGVFNLNYYNCINSFMAIEEYLYHFIWHSSDFQKKKIKKDFINCAMTYYKTAVGLLDEWKIQGESCRRKLDAWLSETLMMAVFDYLPNDGTSFLQVFSHVKRITSNPEVHSFFCTYLPKAPVVSKREMAIRYKLNLLIALYICRKEK